MSKTIHNLKKHVQVRLRIETIAPGGQGFARHESLPVFVDRGVPGDLAEVELYDIRKNFSQARIVQILEPSPLRVEPPCKLFSVCGGCQWQHISAEAQLELKKDMVCQAVEHIGGLDPKIVLPALSSPQTLHYRNKVQYPVGSPSKSTRILAGYYKENSHELINIKHCPVQPEILDQVLEAAKSAAELSGFSAYDEKTHRGLLRHIILRYSFASQETLVTVVLNAAPASFAELESRLNKFAGTLMDACPSVAGFCLNFNNQRGNRIMGKQTKLVRGREFIVEKLASKLQHAPEILRAGLQFQLSPGKQQPG